MKGSEGPGGGERTGVPGEPAVWGLPGSRVGWGPADGCQVGVARCSGGADQWVDKEREASGLGRLREARLEGSQEAERGEAFPVSWGRGGGERGGSSRPGRVVSTWLRSCTRGPGSGAEAIPRVGPRDCTGELTPSPAGTGWPPSSLQALGPSARSLGGTVPPHTVGSPGWLPSPHWSSVGAIAPCPLQVASVGVLRGPESHLAVGRGWAPLLWTLESWPRPEPCGWLPCDHYAGPWGPRGPLPGPYAAFLLVDHLHHWALLALGGLKRDEATAQGAPLALTLFCSGTPAQAPQPCPCPTRAAQVRLSWFLESAVHDPPQSLCTFVPPAGDTWEGPAPTAPSLQGVSAQLSPSGVGPSPLPTLHPSVSPHRSPGPCLCTQQGILAPLSPRSGVNGGTPSLGFLICKREDIPSPGAGPDKAEVVLRIGQGGGLAPSRAAPGRARGSGCRQGPGTTVAGGPRARVWGCGRGGLNDAVLSEALAPPGAGRGCDLAVTPAQVLRPPLWPSRWTGPAPSVDQPLGPGPEGG